MRFYARLWGSHFDHEVGREVFTLGYLTKSGGCTTEPYFANVYDSEAEAWEHLANSNNIGADERGPWSWVEAWVDPKLLPRGR